MDNVPFRGAFFKPFLGKKALANPALARYVIEESETPSGPDEQTNRENASS
jgi:hypothetical protein